MTAFITHFCKNKLLSGCRLLGRCLESQLAAFALTATYLALAIAAVFAWSVSAQTANPAISALRVERADDGLYLWASLSFDLPPAVEAALLKGIPIVFVAEADIFRDRWYWYDKQLAQVKRSIRLAYQPLTRRWRLTVTQGNVAANGVALGQNFDTLPDALAAAQRITRWKISEINDIDPDSRHSIDFHYRLDLSQLPRPFQIGASSQSEWTISVRSNVRPNAPDAAR